MSNGDFAKTYLQLNDAEKAVSDIEKLLDGLDDKMNTILAEAETIAGPPSSASAAASAAAAANGSGSGSGSDTQLEEVPDKSKEINDLIKLSNEIKARMNIEGVKLDELNDQVGDLEKKKEEQKR